jgi:hypothetical protein
MYYPKSQIKANLYTYGGEYILSTTKQDYTGYYYEVSNVKRYTGKFPQDGENTLLYLPPETKNSNLSILNSFNVVPQIIEFNNIFPIYNLSKSPPQTRYIPPYNPNLPSQNNYSVGMYTRFFCKRGNELSYIEISGQDFSKLNSKDPQIAWDLYTAKSLVWYIKGDKEKIYNTNRNLTMLFEQKEKWPGFSQYLKENYLKYYLES